MDDIQVAILVGGQGTRLKPITEQIPKPMVTILDRPFLHILLEMLQDKGFSKFLFLSGYLCDVVSNYFGNGSKFGFDIKYSVEPKLLGTGGGLKNAENLLEDEFLLINGDTFLELDYTNFIDFSRNNEALIDILCYVGDTYDDIKYNLKLDLDNKISAYSKINSQDKFNAVDAGVYYIKKKVLPLIKTRSSSLENEIFPLLINAKQLAGFATKTKFYDIGTIERLANFRNLYAGKAYNQ